MMKGLTNYDQLNSLGIILGLSAEKMSDEQSENLTRQIVDTIKDMPDIHLSDSLVKTLNILVKNVSDDQSAKLAQYIVETTKEGYNTHPPDSLVETLNILVKNMKVNQVENLSHQIVNVMQKSTNSSQLILLSKALENIQTIQIVDYSIIVKLLKHVLVIGSIRQSVLNYAGLGAGERFESLQGFIDWAKKNHRDINWESPPQNPFHIN